MAYVEFIDIMGRVYEARPALIDDDGWTESQYINAQKALNNRIRSWLKIKSRWLFWIGEEAHPRTIAFVGALVATATPGPEGVNGSALNLTLVRRNGDREVVTLA